MRLTWGRFPQRAATYDRSRGYPRSAAVVDDDRDIHFEAVFHRRRLTPKVDLSPLDGRQPPSDSLAIFRLSPDFDTLSRPAL